ncbi:hypothetical protein J2Z42_002516 [Clostridium algifaecis]|uniref:Uncharacterized protein n=1 Tax=Clostridium algifaecis TaxID=1472040 RepID=A0ABS4KUS9_9CLOT|nr:hypothetical protein [Clostridium algifaecis]MBP2033809.1 hypothetical protein [Clostridium algifaecis]
MDNHTDKINNRIENIRNNIYDYNLKEMFSDIDALILEISNCINLEKISEDKVNVFNVILGNINTAVQNKDYQLVSDILKFQLKDFMENI